MLFPSHSPTQHVWADSYSSPTIMLRSEEAAFLNMIQGLREAL
jgi:hypothetical protein